MRIAMQTLETKKHQSKESREEIRRAGCDVSYDEDCNADTRDQETLLQREHTLNV